jgi:glycerol-3-phosphate dehydrogenase (NAD(P)+)
LLESFKDIKKIAVVGIGSWGSAVANEFARNGWDTMIYSHEEKTIDELNSFHRNSPYLPGTDFHPALRASSDPSDFRDRKVVINCIPTQYISAYYKQQSLDISGKYVINGSKGVENRSLRLIGQIFKEEYGIEENAFAHFAGPSHAELLVGKDLTTIVCSSHNRDLSEFFIDAVSSDYLRVYHSDDVTGSQIGGALKNVIAIAAGMIDGFNFGENAKAALITRGLAEISRLGVAMGANPLTFSGLTGIGDLIVTCMSPHSRNWQFGNRMAKGQTVDEIKAEMLMVAEGVATSESVMGLAEKYVVELPIIEQVRNIIYGDRQPKDSISRAIQQLMTRTSTTEVW